MERSSECGITPVNEDECSLSYYNFEDVDQGPVHPWFSSGDFSEISVDSGLGLEGGESTKSAKPTIHHWSEYELYDSWSSAWPAFSQHSHGKHEFDAHLDTSADMPTSHTYQCDLCDESVTDIFYSFDSLRRHKETRHETTDHVQRISSPAPNEGVPKAMNQFQKLSTPPEPSYNSQISSGLSVPSSQQIALSKGNYSPLGSETTDSGDTEMNVDEESLFDDHDVHLYTERKWDEAIVQRLEHIYKQSLYSLVDSQVLHRRKGFQVYGTSSREISVSSSASNVVRKRTRTGCLTCRKRRIKCGEERPMCSNCIRAGRNCEGYTQRLVFKDSIGEFAAFNTNQALHALRQPKPSVATEQATLNATGSAGVQETNLQGGDQTSSGRKRKADGISDENDHGGPHEGGGHGSQEPSKRFKALKSEDRALRFACPFFKRHPESFRTCGMSDHENSSRVKQHISRKHRMPIYCPRCSETFKTEHERDTHVRDAECPVGPKADFICATADQLRTLSRRNTHQTDRENWNAIYKILFPDDPLPESPYLDPLVSYEVNLVREAFLTAAPMAVRTAIQHVIPEEFSDTLQEELERVLRSTHVDVFDQILRRIREGREVAPVHRTTTQSWLQVRSSNTPDSGIGSTVRSGSTQEEPEQTTHTQDRLISFGSGSFDLQNGGPMPFLPPLAQGFESSEYHMDHLSQPPPDGTFDDLLEYLEAPGDSFLTDQS